MATAIITVLTSVFTSYVGPLATALAGMFSGLFWASNALTILGEALICVVGIGIVGSIFRVVYRIFASKLSKRVN